jgi:hypothetical protein
MNTRYGADGTFATSGENKKGDATDIFKVLILIKFKRLQAILTACKRLQAFASGCKRY